MRWGSYRQRFVRPIRWLTCLWNGEIIPVELEMVISSNQSRGHRFLSKDFFTIDQAAEYESKLRDQWVIASPQSVVKELKNKSMI